MKSWLLSILISSACFAHGEIIQPGHTDGEDAPANEAQDIIEAVRLLETPSVSNPRFDKGKIHGCVNGQFSVSGGLDDEFAQGLFKESHTYNVDLRFANASLRRIDDRLSDTRGISIKLHEVLGKKILADPGATDNQDFVLASSPAFFVANVAEFLNYEMADHASGLNGLSLWSLYHAGRSGLERAMEESMITNPLNARYWSQVPSKFGLTQAKFAVDPCPGSHFQDVSTGPNRLRENLAAHLANDSACFDFKVQLRGQKEAMPIEDASVVWQEELPGTASGPPVEPSQKTQMPFVTVARLRLNKQVVRYDDECEALAFTPWHTLVDHRPLGGISRLREAAYRGIMHLRPNLDGQATN